MKQIFICFILSCAIHLSVLSNFALNIPSAYSFLNEPHRIEITFIQKDKSPSTSKIYKPTSKAHSHVHSKSKVNSNFTAPKMNNIHLVNLTLQKIKVKYPKYARQHRQEGKVVVRTWINSKGSIYKTDIIRSSGYWHLDREALKAIKRTLFKHPLLGLKLKDVILELPIEFKLKI